MKQKINWIRLSAIGFIISIFTVVQTSCSKEIDQEEYLQVVGYVYFNNSQHQISITSYNSQRDSTYIMLPSDTLLLTEDLPTGKSYNNYLIANADSVTIVFGFSRIRKYTADSISERNIINLINYDYDSDYQYTDYYSATLHKFTFEFTNEDYENALNY